MANIDVSKIEGYAGMTAEQKVAALEKFTLPEADYSGYVKKELYDKAASETAEWKKKHNALITDDEKNKQETADLLKTLREENDLLKKEKAITGYKAKYLALGYDEKLAEETAKAYADGDTDKVFANQTAFMTAHDKALKAEALKNTPTPPAGSASNAQDYQKQIDDALARNDIQTAAALMRKMQEVSNT